MFRISIPGAFRDIAGGHDRRTLGGNRQPLRAFDFHADRDALEVQHDVGDVFTHTGNGRKLVQHVVDLHAGDGRTLQRRHQDAAQRVAERQAKAALQRFGDQRRLTRRVIARLDVKLLSA